MAYKSKCPDKQSFVEVAREYEGNLSSMGEHYNVTDKTIRNWISRLDCAREVADARTSRDIKARGVIWRKIDEGHLGASMYWLDRSDKLSAEADKQGVPVKRIDKLLGE